MSHGVIFFKGFKNKLGKFCINLFLKDKIPKEKFLNLEKWYQNDNFEYRMIYYMYYYCGHHAC
jgi:hypothetical protein